MVKIVKIQNRKAYYILCILILIIIAIYIINNKTELFSGVNNTSNSNSNTSIPVNDIHFISDNNTNLIDVPIFNYKLMIMKTNNKSGPSTPTIPTQTPTIPTQTNTQNTTAQTKSQVPKNTTKSQVPKKTIPTTTPKQKTTLTPTSTPKQKTSPTSRQKLSQSIPKGITSSDKFTNIQELDKFINTNTNTNTNNNTNITSNYNNNKNNKNVDMNENENLDMNENKTVDTSYTKINLLLPENKQLKYLTVFHHKPFELYKGIGQTVIITDEPFIDMTSAIASVKNRKCLNYLTSSPIMPIGYNLIWSSDLNDDNKIFSVWSPITPNGYVSLGDVIVMGIEQPPLDLCACYPVSLVDKTALSNGIIWSAINDMGKTCYCWGAGTISTFRASNQYNNNMLELQNVYNLSSSSLTLNLLGTDKHITKQ